MSAAKRPLNLKGFIGGKPCNSSMKSRRFQAKSTRMLILAPNDWMEYSGRPLKRRLKSKRIPAPSHDNRKISRSLRPLIANCSIARNLHKRTFIYNHNIANHAVPS